MPTAASSLTEPGLWGWRKSRRRRPSAAAPTTSSTVEPRWPQRLFKRQSTSSLSVATSPQEEPPRRRSFLAKPPAPGSTRRVLAVLNPPPRTRRASAARPPPSTTPPSTVPTPVVPPPIVPPHAPDPPAAQPPILATRAAVLASGYEESLPPTSEGSTLFCHTSTLNDQTIHPPLQHRRSKNHLHSDNQVETLYGESPNHNNHAGHIQEEKEEEEKDVDDNVDEEAEKEEEEEEEEEQIVPDRPVSSFTDDMTDSIARHDSASSSLPSSKGTSGASVDNPATRFVEVDASEVSDELVSSAEAKLSNRCGAARVVRAAHAASALGENALNSSCSPNMPSDTMRGDRNMATDSAPDICDVLGLCTVSVTGDSNRAWRQMQDRARELQHALETSQAEKLSFRLQIDALTRRIEDDNTLISTLRIQSAQATAEADHAIRQLKDTRRRLSRRIRELEHQAAAIAAHHADELAHRRAVERRLRSELDELRDTLGVASSSSRRRRVESGLADSLSRGSMDPCRSRPASCSSMDTSRSRRPRPEIPQVSSRAPSSVSRPGTPSYNGSTSRYHGKTVASATNQGKPCNGQLRKVVNRVGVPGESISPAAALVTVAVQAAGSSERSSMLLHEKQFREKMSSGGCASSPGTLAKRSLFRRAFIAHIQSGRYRSARVVWFDFFGAQGEQVSMDQFARAMRSLAVAADASDEDLTLLRNEVCGDMGDGSGIVSWAMFSRFYEMTKNEST